MKENKDIDEKLGGLDKDLENDIEIPPERPEVHVPPINELDKSPGDRKKQWSYATHGADNRLKDKGNGEGFIGPNDDSRDVTLLGAFTGLEEIDEILNMKETHLSKRNQLVWYFGCKRCFLRGTDECPHGIRDGEEYYYGYCDDALKINLIQYKLMRTPDGLKHLRNINLLQFQNLLQHYIGKLNRLRKSDTLTEKEMVLLGSLRKLYKEVGERQDKAIQQDEGMKIKTEKVMTPSDWDSLVSGAKERLKVKDIEGRVVEDGKEKAEGT